MNEGDAQMTPEKWYSAVDLTGCPSLPKHADAIRNKAINDRWTTKKEGGRVFLLFDSFPDDVKKWVIEQKDESKPDMDNSYIRDQLNYRERARMVDEWEKQHCDKIVSDLTKWWRKHREDEHDDTLR